MPNKLDALSAITSRHQGFHIGNFPIELHRKQKFLNRIKTPAAPPYYRAPYCFGKDARVSTALSILAVQSETIHDCSKCLARRALPISSWRSIQYSPKSELVQRRAKLCLGATDTPSKFILTVLLSRQSIPPKRIYLLNHLVPPRTPNNQKKQDPSAATALSDIPPA